MVRLSLAGALLLVALGGADPAAAGVANPHNVGTCTSCHRVSPQFGIDTRKSVTFTTPPDDPALCRTCHPAAGQLHPLGVALAAGRASQYLPAGAAGEFAGKLVCTTCHFIHASDGRYALLRGFPGSPDPRHYASWQEFCEDCHGTGLAARSPHGGGERLCASCHVAKPRPGAPSEVVGRSSGVCQLCHATIREPHFRKVDPFGDRKECLGCHDAHAAVGDRPGLLNAGFLDAAATSVVVRPHYRKGLCLVCHANTDDYSLRVEDLNELCNRCHASGRIAANIHPLRKVPATIKPPGGWPLADGGLTCLTCHEQGHEDQSPRPFLLRGGPYASRREVCANCHSMSDLLSSTIHVDINEGRRCDFCHSGPQPVPGKDTVKTVTLIADPNLLCLRCHDVGGAQAVNHHRYLEAVEASADEIPEFLPLYQGRVSCATCHNPHELESSGYRLRQGLAGSNVCLGCHRQ